MQHVPSHQLVRQEETEVIFAMNYPHTPMLRLVVAASTVVALALPGRADDGRPTRQAFLGEVLDAKPTPVTPKFNDYTPGSYHIEKEDLLKGLIEEAKKRKITLRALTISGPLPFDPLWRSQVIVFVQDDKKIRVNSLVMPHARITLKATGLITADQFKKWRDGVLDTGVLKKEVPPADEKNDKPKPFQSQFLLVIWSEDGKTQEIHYGDIVKEKKDEKAEKLMEQYNVVLKELKQTY
jgi:hypothetical protein